MKETNVKLFSNIFMKANASNNYPYNCTIGRNCGSNLNGDERYSKKSTLVYDVFFFSLLNKMANWFRKEFFV